VGAGASRIKLDRVVGIGHCALAIVNNGPEIGAAREGLREAWIDFYRLIEGLRGFIEPPLLSKGEAALSKGYRFG
jgi:hypothetical protein